MKIGASTYSLQKAIKAGALGYILKDATRDQLLQAIRDVDQGRASLQPSIAVKLIQDGCIVKQRLYEWRVILFSAGRQVIFFC